MEPKVCCVGRRGLQQAVSLSLAGCVGSARGCSDGAVRGRRSGHGFCNFIASVGTHSAGRGFNDWRAVKELPQALGKDFVKSNGPMAIPSNAAKCWGHSVSHLSRARLASRALSASASPSSSRRGRCAPCRPGWPRPCQSAPAETARSPPRAAAYQSWPLRGQSAMTPRKQFSTAGRPRQGQLPVATLSYIKANGHFIKANGRFIKADGRFIKGSFGGLQGQVRV